MEGVVDILELGMWGWERFREVRSSGVSLGGGVANSTQPVCIRHPWLRHTFPGRPVRELLGFEGIPRTSNLPPQFPPPHPQLQYVSQSLARPTSNAATFWTIDEEMAIFQNEVVVTTRFSFQKLPKLAKVSENEAVPTADVCGLRCGRGGQHSGDGGGILTGAGRTVERGIRCP